MWDSIDPDLLAYMCGLIRNNLMNLKANSVDPDKMAQIL
jgi:hypothetical protein